MRLLVPIQRLLGDVARVVLIQDRSRHARIIARAGSDSSIGDWKKARRCALFRVPIDMGRERKRAQGSGFMGRNDRKYILRSFWGPR
jgi:hypothetical protein